MDPTHEDQPVDETQRIRGPARKPSGPPPALTADAQRSAVRVWPPRQPAPATMADFAIDPSLCDTVEEGNPEQTRPTRPAVEPPATPPAPVVRRPSADAPRCPRCREALIDPNGFGICPGCGYCRSLEQDRDKVPGAAAATAVPAANGSAWVWAVFAGFAAAAGALVAVVLARQ